MIPGVFFDFFNSAVARTQRCKQQYKSARKTCVVQELGVYRTRVVVVACMVLVDVGKIVIWSTVPYAVWEVVEEVGGGRREQMYNKFRWGVCVIQCQCPKCGF